TPWLDFEEGINRYRVQGQMFAEREGVIPGSSDLGVGYLARFPNEFGEVQGGVYNGEGYASAEANRDKSVQVRVTVRPFPRAGLAKGLRLSGYYNAGWYAPDQPRRHGIVMASYEQTHLVATAQWLAATERPRAAAVTTSDRRGYSAFVEVKQGMTGWAGLLRFEEFDADRRTPDNS